MFVSYLYWDRKFDEWISDITNRIAPLNAHTYYSGGKLKVGQRIEVLDERGEWLEAFVIEEKEKEVKIHYRNYHEKFDTWLDRDTSRIRPYGRDKYHVRRSKNAMLWSTGSLYSTSASSSTSNTIGKIPASSSLPSSANGNNRVRYIGDERTRKIQNLSEQFNSYRRALEEKHLIIHPVSGDGNCLFRSVAHQIYGDDRYHNIVRQKCMDYMESEADFFSQFVVGGKETFHLYLQAKRLDGCWGDDPEIEAICELYNRPAEIWAYDAVQGARKLRTFHETAQYQSLSNTNSSNNVVAPSSSRTNVNGSNQPENRQQRGRRNRHPANQSPSSSPNNSSRNNQHDPTNDEENDENQFDPADDELDHLPPYARMPIMRLSYYGGGHYDSIVDRYHAYHVLQTAPGVLEDTNISQSRRRCNQLLTSRHIMEARSASVRDDATVQQVQRATDIEATNQAQLDLAIQESRRLQASYEYDDLETCLALSLSHTGNAPTIAWNSSAGPAESKQNEDEKDSTLQTDIEKSVQQQSEMDYLDQAIVSSLVQDPVMTEEELIQAALLSSAKEAEEEELRRVATVAAISTVRTVTSSATNEEEMMEMALKLSQMSEEEALELALSQSLQQKPQTVISSVNTPSNSSSSARNNSAPTNRTMNELSEEEQLRLAMEESLQSLQPPSNNRNNNSNAMLIYGFGDDMEYDEDLMRAIQESYK